MTVLYVFSGAGGWNNGTSWANAYTTLAGAAAADTEGDILYVSESHSVSTAGVVTLAWAGTSANPTRIICADDSSGGPPTTLATTALVATTGASTITIAAGPGGFVFMYGIKFRAGDSTSNASITISASSLVAESCSFELNGNNSSSRITLKELVKNCTFKFAHASQCVQESGGLYIIGGSILSGGTSPTNFFIPAANDKTTTSSAFLPGVW